MRPITLEERYRAPTLRRPQSASGFADPSPISALDRDKIDHLNAERLLGLPSGG